MIGESAQRPWGSWTVVDEGPGFKVKRLVVAPGQRLSYQTHEHRSEHWYVVSGTLTAVLDGEETIAGPGRSLDVAKGQKHRICNFGTEELNIIEVQRGDYCGEDDIERYEDDYNRAPASSAKV